MKVAAEQANAPEYAPLSRAAGLPQHPRPTSKLAQLIALLSQEGGITIGDISKSMGWLPHTTRATLTGLRKRGIRIVRETPNGGSNSIYRIEKINELTQAA
jgi:predicted ArsR family transcriptional regulator